MSSSCRVSASSNKKTQIWLVGQMASRLKTTRLPSKKEVLGLFFYNKVIKKQTIRASAHSTALSVLEIWKNANIPTKLKKDVVARVENIFKEWQKLKKNKENKAKRSENLQNKEKKWQSQLVDLFDIGHARALKLIRNKEVMNFLESQRKMGQEGNLRSIKKIFLKRKAQKEVRIERLKIRREEGEKKNEAEAVFEKISLQDFSSSEEESCLSDGEYEQSAQSAEVSSTSSGQPRKRGRKKLINDNLAASLDAAKLSDRKAAVVIISTMKSCGIDPMKYNVNSSSIRRDRIHHREKIAMSLKKDFQVDVPLTIHWDGKMLEDITGHKTVDRLPILVSGRNVDQLLAVPKLESGTGESTASAVYEEALSWGLCDKIKCMCFDTTFVNTGLKNGACIRFEQLVQKDMLWLACRHHIMEIMLEAVVVHELGPSSAPEILIFKRFRAHWKNIDKTKFDVAPSDLLIFKKGIQTSFEMIYFAKECLQKYQPRDDYKELLELTIIFLGGTPEKGISFRLPAGVHRARWMAKAIYSLKMFLFRKQFNMTRREADAIREISLFTVRVYIKYWFQAGSAISAPRNDLELIQKLVEYEMFNPALYRKALKKFLGHLWYLSEELVALAFFDDKVSVTTKRKMVEALKNEEGSEDPPKRIQLDTEMIKRKKIENFVTKNTLRFFEIMGFETNFLKKNVIMWDKDESYNKTKQIVNSMKVVNDIAERGVALMEEYNKMHTADEDQKQFLLLVVKQYRQKFPNTNKSTLL